MKVARKFTLAVIAAILVVLSTSVVVRVNREQTAFEQDVARDSRVLGRALGHAVERTWQTRGEEEALELIRYATEQESHLDMRWIWLDTPRGNPHEATVSSDLLEPLRHGEPVVLSPNEGRGPMYTYMPVRVPNGRLGAIEIADPLLREQAYLNKSMLHASITAAVVVGVCALLAWFLGFTLIGRPMGRLVQHARAIGRGELGTRLSLDAKDEIGELAAEMDAMSENLRNGRDRLREETQSRIAAIEQLRHADRLATVGTLASGIAHELATPINVIEGYAQVIREDAAANPRIKDTSLIIDRQCKRMTQIIRQLLDFARQGRAPNGSADVHEVVRETLKMMDPLMRKQDVEASVEQVARNLQVGVEFHQMQQVVANIMVNALQAMPCGGRLEVRANRNRAERGARPAQNNDFVTVSIQDSGVGMDETTASRVFEPFFTTKDVGEGTGLGLSVAYGIIENHGGWIEVESQPLRGSTFTIYLPSEGDR